MHPMNTIRPGSAGPSVDSEATVDQLRSLSLEEGPSRIPGNSPSQHRPGHSAFAPNDGYHASPPRVAAPVAASFDRSAPIQNLFSGQQGNLDPPVLDRKTEFGLLGTPRTGS